MTKSLTPQQLMSDLQKQVYASVYFLQGEESYYIDWLTSYIKNNVLSATERCFNLTMLYGKETSMQQVIMQAHHFPITGKKQVIIIKEAQELFDLQKAVGQKILLNYIASPSLHTMLVFAYKYKKLDMRKAFSKALVKGAVVVNSQTPYENQLPSWISTHLGAMGYSVSAKAALMLSMMVGNNLQLLANELQKIIINIPQGSEVKAQHITQHIGISKDFNIFELEQALGCRDVYKVCQIVEYFSQNPKKHPLLLVINFLTSFFTKLLQLHDKPHTDTKSTASRLQVHPYFVKNYIKATQYYSLSQVIKNIHYLHQADLQAKGIGYPALPERAILKELVTKLILDM